MINYINSLPFTMPQESMQTLSFWKIPELLLSSKKLHDYSLYINRFSKVFMHMFDL